MKLFFSTPYDSDSLGYFGEFGGRYVPELLMPALQELGKAYEAAKADPAFERELLDLFKNYSGRPTPLYFADRLTKELGGAKIYLKNEGLNHTGAHKINHCLGQAILAKRMGKKRLIAETGAGQHGLATATVAAKFGFECTVYMGAVDVARQRPNVFWMEQLGAKVIPVEYGTARLKDAVMAALQDWTKNVQDSYYLLGSALGPHPYPSMVRDFQSIVGLEVKEQIQEAEGRLPDYLVACVGGGSNAIGLFNPFLDESSSIPPCHPERGLAANLASPKRGYAKASEGSLSQPPVILSGGVAAGVEESRASFGEIPPLAATLGRNDNDDRQRFLTPATGIRNDNKSNATGQQQIKMIGVEAGGKSHAVGENAERLQGNASVGVVEGYKSYFIQNEEGQLQNTHSISAGLDYAGIGPEHARLFAEGRVEYHSVTDAEVMNAFQTLARTEGIFPALESAHAVAEVIKLAPTLPKDKIIVVNISGRGDKDIFIVAEALHDLEWKKFLRSKS